MPMPNRSISCALPSGFVCTGAATAAAFPLLEDACARETIESLASSAAFLALASSSSRSRSLSYPSCLIRSASSTALRSASAKSMGAAAFFAPRPPSFDFFGAAAAEPVGVDTAGDELRRDAPSFEPGREPGVEFVRRDEELMVRGPVVVDAARPMTGTPAGVDAAELAGLAAGLSHEEKESSSSFPAAGVADAATVSIPSTKMRVGYLSEQSGCRGWL